MADDYLQEILDKFGVNIDGNGGKSQTEVAQEFLDEFGYNLGAKTLSKNFSTSNKPLCGTHLSIAKDRGIPDGASEPIPEFTYNVTCWF